MALRPEQTIFSDGIVCLECGQKFLTLKRHLRHKHNLTPLEYLDRTSFRRIIRWSRLIIRTSGASLSKSRLKNTARRARKSRLKSNHRQNSQAAAHV